MFRERTKIILGITYDVRRIQHVIIIIIAKKCKEILFRHFPGDPRYRLRFLAISDVRAVTLRVSDVALWEFPLSFVLVMTAGQPAIEYQLDTVIDEPMPYTYDDILDEIRWVALPPSPLTFSYHGSMSAACVAVIDSESESITDELNMYRVTFEKDRARLKKGVLNQALNSARETEVR